MLGNLYLLYDGCSGIARSRDALRKHKYVRAANTVPKIWTGDFLHR
jgi:hypothetical protein